MIYRGRIKDGKVVFNELLPLPDGQEVEIRPVEHSIENDLAWLKQFEGIATDLPADAAANVDRDLYGQSNE